MIKSGLTKIVCMKRIILIIAIVFSVISVLFMASPLILRVTGLDHNVKSYLLGQVMDTKSGSIDIEKYRIGLGTMELSDVAVQTSDNRVNLTIPSVVFDFYFHDIFIHPANPQIAVKSITFKEPVLVLSSVPGTKNTKHKNLDKLFSDLNKIKGINQIRVEQGKIIYKTDSSLTFTAAKNIDGAIIPGDSSKIEMVLEGSVLSSQEQNCRINTVFDIGDRRSVSRVEFLDVQVDELRLPFLPKKMHLRSGFLRGHVLIENKNFNPDSTRFNGLINVAELSAKSGNYNITQADAMLELNDKLLQIKKGRGSLNSNEFEFDLLSKNIFNKKIEANIRFPHLELSALSTGSVQNQIDGLKVHVRYDFTEKKADADLSALRIAAGKELNFQSIRAQLSYEHKEVHIKNASALLGTIKISSRGNWNLENKKLDLSLQASQKSGKHVFFDRLSNTEHLLSVDLHLDTQASLMRGNWYYSISDTADTLLDFRGKISGSENNITVRLTDAGPMQTMAFVNVKNIFSEPVINKAVLSAFPFASFTTKSVLKNFFSHYNSNIRLKGSLGNMGADIEIQDKEDPENDLRLTANLRNILTEGKRAKGSLEIKNLLGFFEVSLADGFLNGRFNFPAGINGKIYLELQDEGIVSGVANFSDFCLTAALTDTLAADDYLQQNRITGNVFLDGTMQQPHLKAQLSADRFVFNKSGYYRADIVMDANKERLSVDSLKISLNNVPISEGNFSVSLSNKALSGNFTGSDVDIEKVLAAIDPQSHSLTGLASYAVSLGGSYTHPKIASSGLIQNGNLYKTPFDHLNFQFTDALSGPNYFLKPEGHHIVFSNLALAREGDFSLEAQGNFPLKKDDSLDVKLHFKGDALAFLPTWVDFFEGGTSLADIQAELGGTRGKIRIKSSICNIDRGELWMASVAPHVQNIHGTIELKKGTNKVNFINLKASVDNKTVTFNTVHNITTSSGRKLKPWYFKGINLDFGVIDIKTENGGVELNIPGLMKQEDSGFLYLTGRSKDEHFYFAGPVKHPVAYGTLRLYNARATYPFITPEKRQRKKSTAVEFLSNMDWDVMLKSGKDVVYHKEIPAYIDNVNTELYMDESSPGLHFKGIISNGTFKPVGKLNSSRGRLEYLDQNFKVDFFSVEFTDWDPYPLISGRAWTTVRDSVGAIPKTIYLKLYAVDKETKAEKHQGSLEDFRFKLESADPQIGEDQEQVLSYMGFSVSNLKEKATSVGGSITERYLIRPLLRPIERVLEQGLGVDMVRINSNIAKNLFFSSFGYNSNENLFFNPFTSNSSYLFLMQSSDITIGKYLSKDLFLTYTGQLVSVYNQNEPQLDINHSFGIEYRFLRNVLVEFEFDRELMRYQRLTNEKQYLNDFKIRLRQSFTF